MKRLFSSLLLLLLAVGCAQRVDNIVFQKGDFGYNTFRIPALVESKKGTILAFAEARKDSHKDTGNIDLVLRRSTDGGRSWGDMIVVWDCGDNVCGNPSPVVISSTGRIVLLACWNRGDDHEWDIHARKSIDTRRVYTLYSDDDGLTWSTPRDITESTKRDEWTWYATGPCHALEIRGGEHKGRLVVPCNHGVYTEDAKRRYSEGATISHVIYSDDQGLTWSLGADAGEYTNESSVAELSNGDIVLNARGARLPNRQELGACRTVVFSSDGGESFGEQILQRELIEPVCNGSIINYYNRDGSTSETLLFSNPHHKSERKDLSIQMSRDNGKSWSMLCQLTDTHSAYSDLLVTKNRDVAILFESGVESYNETLRFIRLPRREIRTASTSLENKF